MKATLSNDITGVPVLVDGVIIGRGTSKTDESLRWNEVDIWKSLGGAYVVHKRGMNKVYHSDAPGACNYGQPAFLADLDGDTTEPCPVCKPPYDDQTDEQNQTVRLERTRSSVHVSGSPDGVVESLYSVDENKVRYMNRVAASALRQAIIAAPELGKAKITVS